MLVVAGFQWVHFLYVVFKFFSFLVYGFVGCLSNNRAGWAFVPSLFSYMRGCVPLCGVIVGVVVGILIQECLSACERPIAGVFLCWC